MSPSPKEPNVWHPFLVALFPILALYAHNIKNISIAWTELAIPLAISGTGSAIIFFILRAVLKNPAKAGIVSSLFILWFLSFGHLAAKAAVWTEGVYNRSLCFATLILVGLITYPIIRTRRALDSLTRLLNLVFAALLLFNLASVAQTLASRATISLGQPVKVSRQTLTKPNIYFLVFDAYTRADILSEVFAFDNSGFLSDLEARGFIVASRSYANYGSTAQSLASSLNFTYLDSIVEEVGAASSDREPLHQMIRENRAMSFLRSRGYRLMTVSSGYVPTDIRSVDRYFGFAKSPSEFRSVLLNTTPLPLFFSMASDGSSYEAHRKRVLHTFKVLADSPKEKGPFFMFAHFMAPHPPFVFGANGEPLEPDYAFTILDADRLHGNRDTDRREYIVHYRDQLAYLNRKILETIDVIMATSSEPPIIILQGDHGSRVYADFDQPEVSYTKENLAILNAMHLPGKDHVSVYPEISPVNTFRLIFRQYFAAEIDLLDDRSYTFSWRRPYRFHLVDENSYEEPVDSFKNKIKPQPPVIQKKQSER